MATVTGTSGMALGNIPLTTPMVDKDAVTTLLSGVTTEVSQIVAEAVSTAWKAGGSKAPTDLTSALLVSGNEGRVYNMSSSGTTDANFVEGSGTPYLAGTDVAVINTAGSGDTPVYKFNILAAHDSSVMKSVRLGSSSGVELTPDNGSVTLPHAGDTISGTTVDGLMSADDKSKLDSIASGAQVNQNAFSKIAVSGVSGTGDAESVTDTLTLVPGSNVTMSRDGNAVTINATVPTVSDAGSDTKGVVYLASGISDNRELAVTTAAQVSGAISGLTSGISEALSGLVSGGTLHSNLVSRSLANPSGTPTSGTIYALLAALHAADNTSES